jgi:DNA transformation protein
MSISAGYIESVRELLAFVPELEIKRMFGAAGATTGGMMFAILDDDELWLKADDQTRPAFEAAGLEQFKYPTKDGEHMSLAYWRAPAEVWDDEDAARQWVIGAIEAAMRKKAMSKSRPKKAKAKKA